MCNLLNIQSFFFQDNPDVRRDTSRRATQADNAQQQEQKAAFDAVDLGKGTIPQDELLAKRLPEMPAELVPIIEEIWAEEVVGK